jgi:thiol-disulfide isomerase/thioredoxin
MKMTPSLPVLLLTALPLTALVACGGTTTVNPDEQNKDSATDTCDPLTYPCGPYGYAPGAIVANLSLVGQHDDNNSGLPTDDAVKPIHFADYFAQKGYKALVVLAAAEWCSPCQAEQPELVSLFNAYKANGNKVAMVEAIVQDKDGNPADMTVVDRWTNRFHLPFDMVADPGNALNPYYDINAFPMQMVVRTSDMKIIWQNNGLATEELKASIDGVIAH